VEIFSIIVQFFDIVLSAFVSIYNIFRALWREIILATLLLILALILLRFLRALKKRMRFINKLRASAKENGLTIKYNRPCWLSLVLNFGGYDIEVEVRGVLYRLKLYPFNPHNRGILLDGSKSSRILGPLATRRAMNGTAAKGIGVKLDYDTEQSESTVNILVFSPDPIAVLEENAAGTVWELDTENGAEYHGVYLFSASVLGSRLPRLMDGYIDELRHTDEV